MRAYPGRGMRESLQCAIPGGWEGGQAQKGRDPHGRPA